jgi:hypothetical protein
VKLVVEEDYVSNGMELNWFRKGLWRLEALSALLSAMLKILFPGS